MLNHLRLNPPAGESVLTVGPLLRTAFLAITTSASRVSEIEVVLTTMLMFTPKVSPDFHQKREIVISAFLDAKLQTVNALDLGKDLLAYSKY